MSSIEAHREFYARLVVDDRAPLGPALLAAFSRVPRERFLGPGPWSVFDLRGNYLTTPTDDPRILYQDSLVALAADRGINNGQPSLHARLLSAVAPVPGETVVHVGAGTGYYSAILAELVGPEGTVHAYEVDAALAARAREHLADYRRVDVRCASASEGALPRADVIYVSAGATHPLGTWLDALTEGGRLLFPLTGSDGRGVVALITRLPGSRYAARLLWPAAFIDCAGARDEAAGRAVTAAIDGSALAPRRAVDGSSPVLVRSLRRNDSPDATAWCAGDGWWFSSAAAE